MRDLICNAQAPSPVAHMSGDDAQSYPVLLYNVRNVISKVWYHRGVEMIDMVLVEEKALGEEM